MPNVINWPTTEPSINRCTRVNNRKQAGVRQLYNQVPKTVWVTSSCSWSQMETRSRIESQRQTEGFGPSVTHGRAAKMRKKCCYGQKNFGSICSRLSPFSTHLSHTTNINPFENKVWEIYFYKEVCSFVHWSSSLLLTMFLHIFVYIYIYIYMCVCVCVLWVYNTYTKEYYRCTPYLIT